MSRIRLVSAMGLTVFALATSHAVAQVFERAEPPPFEAPGRVFDRSDVPMCGTTAGASRVRSKACEPEGPTQEEQLVIRAQPIDLPPLPVPQCEATATTEYRQVAAVARVDSTISLAVCPAGSSGEFTFVMRVEDDSGEIRPLEFKETWQRNDSQDVKVAADYPIGEDVELVNVRMRGLICTCVEPASGEAASADPPSEVVE
jgi:hypothetical protein